MNIKMKLEFVLIFLICGIFLFSCTSLQDVNIEQSGISGEFLEIHSSFASVDGAFAAKNGNGELAENLILMMEKELSDPGLLKTAAARIYALEGCVYLRLGRKSEAKKLYEKSASESKGDVYAIILAHRIDSSNPLEKDSVLGNDKAVLVLENALDFYAEKDYVSAVSCFDEAFLSLADYYRKGYGALRDECWSFRNVDFSLENESDLNSLLALKKITVAQMLLITKDSSDFLYNLTGGKKISEKELFKKVSDSGLLDAASVHYAQNSDLYGSNYTLDSKSISKNDEKSSALSADSVVNKFVTVRFLWNLYNENKSLDKKTKYSARFSKLKMRSPVPDVPVSSPDFDAVLGCVENEFIHLEDGTNFNGKKEVSGLEFSESLKKLDSGR